MPGGWKRCCCSAVCHSGSMHALLILAAFHAQQFPSEIPAKLTIPDSAFEYRRQSVMIPMRDGVKLSTQILVPKGAKSAAILLTRTP